MTQVRIDTNVASYNQFPRQMQNGASGPTPTTFSPAQLPANSITGRGADTVWGNISRGDGRHGSVDRNRIGGSIPARREAAHHPHAQQETASRRASAFPFQAFVPQNLNIGAALGQTNHFEGNEKGQKTMRRPWNPSIGEDVHQPYVTTRQEMRAEKTYDGGPSPTGTGMHAVRHGSEDLWKAASLVDPTHTQSTFHSRPSFSRHMNNSTSPFVRSDQLRQTNGQINSHGRASIPSGRSDAEALSLPSPSSSSSTRPNAKADQMSATDIERSLQQFSFSNGPSSAQCPRHFLKDQSEKTENGGRMVRAGSSPGQSSLHSGLGWNGGLASQWSVDVAPGGSRDDGRLIPDSIYASGMNANLPPTHAYNDRLSALSVQATGQDSPRHNSFSEELMTTRRGIGSTDASNRINFHPGLTDPSFQSQFLNNGSYSGIPNIPGMRNTSASGRELMLNSHPLNLPGEFANPSLNPYCGTRYGSAWPSAPFSIPPSPSMPLITEHDTGRVWRSALLEEFRMSHRSGRRWELKDIYGHVVEFAGDQHGSRFLQDKLKTANSEEKQRVFEEIHPNAVQLMKDVFGNYVLQKFFEHGDQVQKAALVKKMKGHVYALSTQTYACRVVQKALALILVEQQVDLMQELDGKVVDCIKCENGNHVIQIAIQQVPLEHVPFMIDAIQRDVQYLSMHKYGCRVIQRLLENAKEDVLVWLIPALHECSPLLIADQFGNYVPAHIVEKGSPEDRNQVIEVVRSNLIQYSKQKFASHVVEKCIRFGADHQRKDFMHLLCSVNGHGENELEHLIRDGFANYVVQSLLETLQYNDYIDFCRMLQPALDRARLPSPNKQADNVARRMRRFDQASVYPQPQSQPYMHGPVWHHSVFV